MEPIEEIAYEVNAIKIENREFRSELANLLEKISCQLDDIRNLLAGGGSAAARTDQSDSIDDEFTRLINEFEKNWKP